MAVRAGPPLISLSHTPPHKHTHCCFHPVRCSVLRTATSLTQLIDAFTQQTTHISTGRGEKGEGRRGNSRALPERAPLYLFCCLAFPCASTPCPLQFVPLLHPREENCSSSAFPPPPPPPSSPSFLVSLPRPPSPPPIKKCFALPSNPLLSPLSPGPVSRRLPPPTVRVARRA